MTETTRRAVLTGAVAAGTAAALAACGDGDAGAPGGAGVATPDAGTTGSGTTGAPDGAQAAGLARKADIPVGGGKIFAEQDVVITQPAAGTFKGFSAACTHEGCTVSSVRDGVIRCACHGSMFSAADGSVKGGPATRSLAAKDLKVEGDTIALA